MLPSDPTQFEAGRAIGYEVPSNLESHAQLYLASAQISTPILAPSAPSHHVVMREDRARVSEMFDLFREQHSVGYVVGGFIQAWMPQLSPLVGADKTPAASVYHTGSADDDEVVVSTFGIDVDLMKVLEWRKLASRTLFIAQMCTKDVFSGMYMNPLTEPFPDIHTKFRAFSETSQSHFSGIYWAAHALLRTTAKATAQHAYVQESQAKLAFLYMNIAAMTEMNDQIDVDAPDFGELLDAKAMREDAETLSFEEYRTRATERFETARARVKIRARLVKLTAARERFGKCVALARAQTKYLLTMLRGPQGRGYDYADKYGKYATHIAKYPTEHAYPATLYSVKYLIADRTLSRLATERARDLWRETIKLYKMERHTYPNGKSSVHASLTPIEAFQMRDWLAVDGDEATAARFAQLRLDESVNELEDAASMRGHTMEHALDHSQLPPSYTISVPLDEAARMRNKRRQDSEMPVYQGLPTMSGIPEVVTRDWIIQRLHPIDAVMLMHCSKLFHAPIMKNNHYWALAATTRNLRNAPTPSAAEAFSLYLNFTEAFTKKSLKLEGPEPMPTTPTSAIFIELYSPFYLFLAKLRRCKLGADGVSPRPFCTLCLDTRVHTTYIRSSKIVPRCLCLRCYHRETTDKLPRDIELPSAITIGDWTSYMSVLLPHDEWNMGLPNFGIDSPRYDKSVRWGAGRYDPILSTEIRFNKDALYRLCQKITQFSRQEVHKTWKKLLDWALLPSPRDPYGKPPIHMCYNFYAACSEAAHAGLHLPEGYFTFPATPRLHSNDEDPAAVVRQSFENEEVRGLGAGTSSPHSRVKRYPHLCIESSGLIYDTTGKAGFVAKIDEFKMPGCHAVGWPINNQGEHVFNETRTNRIRVPAVGRPTLGVDASCGIIGVYQLGAGVWACNRCKNRYNNMTKDEYHLFYDFP